MLDYLARVAALYSVLRDATNCLEISKKLFSLLRYRTEPVPSTMAATAGMLAATSRAYRTCAFPRAAAAGPATLNTETPADLADRTCYSHRTTGSSPGDAKKP
ncbi:hypothetical protein WI41_27070 [Burkholderia latens]|uniref:Uncharacterized protein n=1 Tax=Burkholderia latens TaxID=488446 RepID=A0AAP1C161_9BURK|nr:hypothetical protein [Burkholderia latens]KUZ98972.1 hypothetical protein WI41_27070 [Burkholderia latens]